MEAIEHLRVDGIEKGPSQLTKLPESLGSLKALKILMLNDCDVLLQVFCIICISRSSISRAETVADKSLSIDLLFAAPLNFRSHVFLDDHIHRGTSCWSRTI